MAGDAVLGVYGVVDALVWRAVWVRVLREHVRCVPRVRSDGIDRDDVPGWWWDP